MLFFQITLLLEIDVETVVLALLFSPCSSMILKCKLSDFLGAYNLSNFMGSTTGSERFLTLLRATRVELNYHSYWKTWWLLFISINKMNLSSLMLHYRVQSLSK